MPAHTDEIKRNDRAWMPGVENSCRPLRLIWWERIETTQLSDARRHFAPRAALARAAPGPRRSQYGRGLFLAPRADTESNRLSFLSACARCRLFLAGYRMNICTLAEALPQCASEVCGTPMLLE